MVDGIMRRIYYHTHTHTHAHTEGRRNN